MILNIKKKPIIVEAVQWIGINFSEIANFCGKECFAYLEGKDLYIHTLEGDHKAVVGDYIIKGVKGECYPCKESIFNETYDVVN